MSSEQAVYEYWREQWDLGVQAVIMDHDAARNACKLLRKDNEELRAMLVVACKEREESRAQVVAVANEAGFREEQLNAHIAGWKRGNGALRGQIDELAKQRDKALNDLASHQHCEVLARSVEDRDRLHQAWTEATDDLARLRKENDELRLPRRVIAPTPKSVQLYRKGQVDYFDGLDRVDLIY